VIMSFSSGMFGSGLGGLLGGLFGNSSNPYDKAMQQYQQYANQAQATQQPYLNAGQGAIGNYQNWLQGQQDPSGFVNHLMDQYQESPYNNYLQQQSQRAGQNEASASGLMGSTPFLQQQQQNSANIGQQGINDWLKQVLGINQQYGQGQQNLMAGGQGSANKLSDMYNQLGQHMGEQTYNREASKQNNLWNTIGSGLGLIGSFL
jgi:hypothetical protein